MAAKVVCISVIDESDTSAQLNNRNTDFNNFRTSYPYREIWLLNPLPAYTSQLGLPSAWNSDPLAFGPITVSRQDSAQSIPGPSDWFTITGLDQAESGTVVSLAVDTSGSLVLADVQQSYNNFIADCNAAGFVLVVNTTFSNERWILPHNISVPTNCSITANPTTILLGTSSTVSWTTAGDVNSLSVTGVTNPDLSGSIVVSPTVSTTYFISANGPAGNSGDDVTVNVVTAPVINSLSASPNPQTSGNDGVPNYNATITWSGSTGGSPITSATISSTGGYSASGPASASGSFQVTNLPQSTGLCATRTYTLTLCNAYACSTDTVDIEVCNDNTPSNSWTTEFTGLEPILEYRLQIGTLAGIDMVIKVSAPPESGVQFAASQNGSYNNPQYFSNGDAVFVKMTTLDFNEDLSGLPANQTFGKPNPKTIPVTVGSLPAFDVTFTTRPPNIGETFDYDGEIGALPNPDIDLLVSPDPETYMETQTETMDDIDVTVEIQTDDPNVQIKIGSGEWQNIGQGTF